MSKETYYPENLIETLFINEPHIDTEYIVKNFEVNISEILATIPQREADILMKRFRDGMTLKEIASIYRLSQDRIRQLESKAIRRLRVPSRLYKLRYGVDVLQLQDDIKKLTAELVLKKQTLLSQLANPELIDVTEQEVREYTKIEHFDFSVRTFNCLKRGGIDTLGELLNHTDMQLLRIRNLGRKCLLEIITKLQEHGFELKKEE